MAAYRSSIDINATIFTTCRAAHQSVTLFIDRPTGKGIESTGLKCDTIGMVPIRFMDFRSWKAGNWKCLTTWKVSRFLGKNEFDAVIWCFPSLSPAKAIKEIEAILKSLIRETLRMKIKWKNVLWNDEDFSAKFVRFFVETQPTN